MAGEQIAAGRHAGHGAAVVVIKNQAALGQPVDVGGLDPGGAVGIEVVAVEGVEHDEHGFHGWVPFVSG